MKVKLKLIKIERKSMAGLIALLGVALPCDTVGAVFEVCAGCSGAAFLAALPG